MYMYNAAIHYHVTCWCRGVPCHKYVLLIIVVCSPKGGRVY